jgi:hypothetical protein
MKAWRDSNVREIRFVLTLAFTAAMPCFAQTPPANPGAPNMPAEAMLTRDTLSRDQMKQLAEFMDNNELRRRKDLVAPRIAASRMTRALQALKVDCDVSAAAQIAEFIGKHWGRNASAGIYEAACRTGAAYRVTLRDTGEATAISCFAIDASPPTDAGGFGEGIEGRCSVSVVATANQRSERLLSALGTSCQVTDSRWLGEQAATHLEYVEAKCADGAGYVLRLPTPGSTGSAAIDTCAQSREKGIGCVLTATPSVSEPAGRPDLAWFKSRLSAANVKCDVAQARIVGREKIRRRYVVEFQCRDAEAGVVAFVPPPDADADTLESMDCEAAVARGVTCEFSKSPAASTP